MMSQFIKKAVTAVGFFICIFAMAFINIKDNYQEFEDSITGYFSSNREGRTSLEDYFAQVNDFMNENTPYRDRFFESYGYLQRLMLKNEVNNFTVVKTKNNQLYYTYFTTEANVTSELTNRMDKFAAAARETGAQVLYLMTPDKYERGYTQFETGMPYNYANETADQFLAELADKGIDYIDFRQLMTDQDMRIEDAFYHTDHHWKIETAFWAFTQLTNILVRDYGLEFNDQEMATDINNYNKVEYEDSYLGSMGRSVGRLYTDPEDISIIYPKFATDYFVYEQSGDTEISREGSFEEAILIKEILMSDDGIYAATSDKYFTYMDGNPAVVQVLNNNHPDGAKVLFVKDSLIVPVASFFAQGLGEMTLVDPRYYGGSIDELMTEGDYDYVFVTFSPQNLTEEFFPFGQDE